MKCTTNAKRLIRSYIRNTPYTCRIYLKTKATVLQLPNKETDYHIAAFPRCANTFTRHLAKHFFPDKIGSTHIHTIATIKMALKYNIPTFVIIRDPISCISSLCIKRNYAKSDANKIEELICDYLEYHKFVYKNLSSLKLFNFSDIIIDPISFVTSLQAVLGVDIAVSKEKIDNAVIEFQFKDDLRDPLGSSMPTSERNTLKKQFDKIVADQTLIKDASSIYCQICDETSQKQIKHK